MSSTQQPAKPQHQGLKTAPLPTGTGRETDVAQMFNCIAPTYDRLNDWISLGMHRGWKCKAVKALRLQQSAHVLDVATGTGDLVAELLKHMGRQGFITGVDISGEMLSIAQKRFTSLENQGRVTFKQGSAMALPFEDNTFTGSVISFGLRNVDDTATVIGEMARVTHPGGWVVSLDTAPDPWIPGFWWYFSKVMPTMGRWMSGDTTAYQYLYQSTQAFASPKELQQQFEAAGLRHVHVQRVAFGSAAIVAGQKPEK